MYNKKKLCFTAYSRFKKNIFLNSVNPEFKRVHTKNATILQGRFKDHI